MIRRSSPTASSSPRSTSHDVLERQPGARRAVRRPGGRRARDPGGRGQLAGPDGPGVELPEPDGPDPGPRRRARPVPRRHDGTGGQRLFDDVGVRVLYPTHGRDRLHGARRSSAARAPGSATSIELLRRRRRRPGDELRPQRDQGRPRRVPRLRRDVEVRGPQLRRRDPGASGDYTWTGSATTSRAVRRVRPRPVVRPGGRPGRQRRDRVGQVARLPRDRARQHAADHHVRHQPRARTRAASSRPTRRPSPGPAPTPGPASPPASARSRSSSPSRARPSSTATSSTRPATRRSPSRPSTWTARGPTITATGHACRAGPTRRPRRSRFTCQAGSAPLTAAGAPHRSS